MIKQNVVLPPKLKGILYHVEITELFGGLLSGIGRVGCVCFDSAGWWNIFCLGT
jgi:hypothetical protein